MASKLSGQENAEKLLRHNDDPYLAHLKIGNRAGMEMNPGVVAGTEIGGNGSA
jgi:hypothetical protein